VFYRWWSVNDKSVHGFWEIWSLNAFRVKAMTNYSQFCPHRPLFRWMCEEFWTCDFSIGWCLLAIEKKPKLNPKIWLVDIACWSRSLFKLANNSEKLHHVCCKYIHCIWNSVLLKIAHILTQRYWACWKPNQKDSSLITWAVGHQVQLRQWYIVVYIDFRGP